MIRKDTGNFEGNSDGTKIGQQSRISGIWYRRTAKWLSDGWMDEWMER